MDESVAKVSGKYFSDCKVAKMSKDAENAELGRELWRKSVEILEMDETEEFEG